jgi:ABC-type multidrug transport system ATPase subunit/ABC-type multidrug transport system permease subunit
MPVFSINADEEDVRGSGEPLIRHEVSGSKRGSYSSKSYEFLETNEEIREITIECNILSYSVSPMKTIVDRISDRINGVENTDLIELLHGVYAEFRPGELVCLMGSSGAGKTTLLNVLSGRAGGVLMGDIKYNGRILPQQQMRLAMNYIPQDDILMAALTPREVLTYTAELRLNTTQEDRRRRVESLMEMLGINRCADVMIGDALHKGISGGQRKRVSVGMELVNNPSILFVDEATTGLDSQTAQDLVDILREIALTGRTVICTIHQPSYEVFERFDRLLLLDSGRVVYNGPVKESTSYFSRLGHTCPEFVNPIEFFMKIIAEEQPVVKDEFDAPAPLNPELAHSGRKIVPRPLTRWHKAWKDHSQNFSMQTSDADLKKYHGVGEGQLARGEFSHDSFEDLDYPNTMLAQFMVLLRRCMWMTWKDPRQFRARLILCTIVGLFGGLVYYNTSKSQFDVQNRLSIIFQSIFFNGTNMLMNTVVLFPLERAVITREFRNGAYRMIAYYIARVITAIMFQCAYVFVFVTISYWMIGFERDISSFLAYMFALVLLGSIAVTLGIVIGGIVPSVQMGPAIVSPLLIPLSVFSGFLVSPNLIPPWFIWIYYISFFQYTFHFMVTTQFYNVYFPCCGANCNGLVCNGTTVTVPQDPVEYCPYGYGCITGKDFLENYQYPDSPITIPICVGTLVGTLFALIVAGFCVMLWRGNQKIA